jgi:hypothetical protein
MLVAGASVLAFTALSFGVAFADSDSSTAVTPQVTVGADYTYLGLNNSAGNLNLGGVSASGVMPIGQTPFIVQGDVGYHYVSAEGGNNINTYNVGGSVAYATSEGRLGAAVSYNGFDVGHGVGNLGAVSYGAYGEWYFNDRITAGLKAGAISPTGDASALFNHETAAYVGVQGIGYVTPNLSLGGSYDWAGQGPLSISTAGVTATYQVSQRYPVTVFGGWAYTNTSFGNLNVEGNGVNVGVKYTFGGGGSLEHRDRTGVDSWGPVASALRALF